MSGALLELQEITKTFGGVTAVKDLSFSVNQGEIVGLIGPNGAGKTTAFNSITGFCKPTSGKIFFQGKDISGKKPHKVAQLGIARTFQTVRPLPRMTVIENVIMGGLFGRDHTLSIKSAKERALQILDYTILREKSEVLAGNLSLAEQRRLELARSLACQPKLLMLDEVMAGLNPREISNTLDLLFKLNSEKHLTLIVIEHVLKAVMKLCGRIIVMDHGMKIAEGKPSEIVTNLQVIEAYMGEKKAGTSRRPRTEAESTASFAANNSSTLSQNGQGQAT